MVGIGADLDTFFHWHPDASLQTPTAFLTNNVTFPKAGTYLVALDGQLEQGPVANSTNVTISGTPAMAAANLTTAAAARGASDNNSTVLVVRSIPMQPQQPAVSLSSLIVSPNALSTLGNTTLYTASLSGPQGAACKPGVPEKERKRPTSGA